VFLQITCDDAVDLPVPGKKYSFGVVKAAQARGDFEVLMERDRRALRAHLGTDVAAGLDTLRVAFLTSRDRLSLNHAERWTASSVSASGGLEKFQPGELAIVEEKQPRGAHRHRTASGLSRSGRVDR
jgi:hypothetical protein